MDFSQMTVEMRMAGHGDWADAMQYLVNRCAAVEKKITLQEYSDWLHRVFPHWSAEEIRERTERDLGGPDVQSNI
jgi:hypothetical protein